MIGILWWKQGAWSNGLLF